MDNQRVAAVEILINSPYISDLIEKGKIDDIKEVMARSTEQGMQTFDQALFNLYKEGKITKENAIKYADSKNNVGLQIRLGEEKTLMFKMRTFEYNPMIWIKFDTLCAVFVHCFDWNIVIKL